MHRAPIIRTYNTYCYLTSNTIFQILFLLVNLKYFLFYLVQNIVVQVQLEEDNIS